MSQYAPDLHATPREKLFYTLVMFPYPSGYGLHVGHASNFVINDVLARYKRLQGYTVFNPFGYDSFGLPTENYAMKMGKPAYQVTEENIAYFKQQVAALHLSFDTEREVVTSSPDYYKRTQWLFEQLYKAGLVYRDTLRVNRCPECQTVLANDQVVEGACERCRSEIIQKKHPQWFIKITDYADKLMQDLDLIDRPEETKIAQRNWIGRSEGTEIVFKISEDGKQKISEDFDQDINKISFEIIGSAYDVHKALGSGLTEKIYHKAMIVSLQNKGLLVESEKTIPLHFQGERVGFGKVDLLIEGKFAVELKSRKLIEGDYLKQLRTYMNQGGFESGLILNFYNKSVEPIRLNKEKPNNLQKSSENNLQKSLSITVFTTRPDTLYGVTALVLAPENTILDDLLVGEYKTQVEEYRQITLGKTAVQRQKELKEKTGVFSGLYATHPLTGENVPIWYADYVLPDYGTGAVMMVPAHDERDWEFAQKFGIEVRQVISPHPRPLPTASLGEGGGLLSNNCTESVLEDGSGVEKNACKCVHEGCEESACVDDISTKTYKNTMYPSSSATIIEYAKELRKQGTNGENFVWELLRNRKFNNLKWRRQFPLLKYIADFYCDALKLVIEIDGPHHAFQKEYDQQRDEAIGSLGISVERISADTLYHQPGTLFEIINQYTKKQAKTFPSPSDDEGGTIGRGRGGGAYTGPGVLINSAEFDGLDSVEAKKAITDHLDSLGKGNRKTTYKLRDRSVSRQRYRGCPIPVYYEVNNEMVPYFEYKDPERKHKPGKPTLTRKVIQVIVKDKDSNLYAWLQWKHDNDLSGFFGGIEDGETVQEAIRRELLEEAGFQDVTLVKEILAYHCKFFHPTKKRNQYSICHARYVEVDRTQVLPIQPSEQQKHEIVWMQPDDFFAVSNNETTCYVLRLLIGLPQQPWGEIAKYNEYNPLPEELKIPHLVPEEQLPVVLPLDLANYKPTGKSPLEDHPTFKYYNPKNNQVPFFRGVEDRTFDETKPVVCREYISSLIYHPTTDTYCFIKRDNSYGIALMGGGCEAGESIEMAARREVIEESGYVHLTHQKTFTEEVHSLFYAHHKQENRYMIQRFVIFTLDDDVQQEVQHESHEQFSLVWLSKEEIRQTHFMGNHQYFLNLYFGRDDTLSYELRDQFNEYNPIPTYLRECDTLDTFMCSSFYFLRYPDANNPDQFCDPQLLNKCFPIDFYIGGKEHTVGHLLYARFIHKFLYDQGWVSSPEPFQRLIHQGMVLGADGRKMSKRRGNIIDPIQVIETYGADALRTYLMFMGPVDQEKVWNDGALAGVGKFLTRVQKVQHLQKNSERSDLVERALHKAIKGVTHDMEALKFNTAVSKLMIFLNTVEEHKTITNKQLSTFMLLLFPFAPVTSREIWESLGNTQDIESALWPVYDPSLVQDDAITLPVQINGKVRANIIVSPDADEAMVLSLAQQDTGLKKYLDGQPIRKVIYVQGRILNIVV